MLVINNRNIDLVKKISNLRDVLRVNTDVKLDLSRKEVDRLIAAGIPSAKILRSWINCTSSFVKEIGIDQLNYNELEAITLNPAIAKMALENSRFEELLPGRIFAEAMAGLSYDDCQAYRLDILDVLKIDTIRSKTKARLISDALAEDLLPIDCLKTLENLGMNTISHDLALNLAKIESKHCLINPELIDNAVFKDNVYYNGLMAVTISGTYNPTAFRDIFIYCDKHKKYDYIRYMPKIPSDIKTTSWFDACKTSPAAMKFVATCGLFSSSSLHKFITIIEQYGTMADMILLFENRRLKPAQKQNVRKASTPIINVTDYRPSLFNTYITEGSTSDIKEFALIYRKYPTVFLTLLSHEALALTGIYYLTHIRLDIDFLLEYLLRTHMVVLNDNTVNDLISVIIDSKCFDAMLLFILSDKVPVSAKNKLYENF